MIVDDAYRLLKPNYYTNMSAEAKVELITELYLRTRLWEKPDGVQMRVYRKESANCIRELEACMGICTYRGEPMGVRPPKEQKAVDKALEKVKKEKVKLIAGLEVKEERVKKRAGKSIRRKEQNPEYIAIFTALKSKGWDEKKFTASQYRKEYKDLLDFCGYAPDSAIKNVRA